MTRLTLVEARRELESNVLPRVSDYWADKLKASLQEAESDATAHVSDHVSGMDAEAREIRTAALKELTDVRDAMDDLGSRIASGRVFARDAASAIHELHGRQQAAEAQLARVGEVAELMAGIEADPIGWWSGQQDRMPALRWESPW